MKKFVVFLIIATITISGLGGFLFYQLNVVQTEKNELKDDLFEAKTQLEEEQNKHIQLREEILGLEKQLDEYETQIFELENQNDELEKQISELETDNVKIIEFTTSGIDTLGGLALRSDANVTIKNFGKNDVYGLTLVLKSSTTPVYHTVKIDHLWIGQEQKIITYVDWIPYNQGNFSVTLKKGTQILDEVGNSW